MIRRIVYAIAVSAFLASAIFAQQGTKQPGYKPDELVCRILPECSIEQLNAVYGTSTRGHQSATGCYLLLTPASSDVESLAVEISADPCVVYCGANYYLAAPEGLQRSSPFADCEGVGDIETQAAVEQLSLPAAQEVSLGTDVRVAIIDGGMNFAHPYFQDKPGGVVSVYDYVDGDSVAYDEPDGSNSGHGTFVAGITRLTAPAADLYIYRVLDTSGIGDGYSVASAVLQAVEDSCRIINLSLGMIGINEALDDALRYACEHDRFMVAAAGNDSTDAGIIFPFPASRSYCMAVAALDSLDLKADFSNYGQKIAVSAPGEWVYGPYLDTLYAWWDGTSFAAPFVSGVAALIWSEHPEWSSGRVDTIICTYSRNIDSVNPDYVDLLGAGMIDASAAVSGEPLVGGDLTGDGLIDIGDLTYLIAYLYIDPESPSPGVTGDVDCNDVIDIGDLTALIAYLYIQGDAPCLF